MFSFGPGITLDPKNKSWEISQIENGNVQMALRKEKWEIQVVGFLSSDASESQFINDPASFFELSEKSNQLHLIGKSWKNSGIPLTFCAELGIDQVPWEEEENFIRFYGGIVLPPYSLPSIVLGSIVKYNKHLAGKEKSYLGEFLALLKQFYFSAPVVIPKMEVPRSILYNFGNSKLERVESYDSGSYAAGGSYSIEESIYLYGDHSCFYRYLKVVSMPGLSGGMDQRESRGTWAHQGNSLDLTLWDIPNKRFTVERLNQSKLSLNGEAFWWSKI